MTAGKHEKPKEKRRMEAHVSSFANGLKIYRDVRLIRIKSKQYTLLIMEDYLPVIGEIDGGVWIVTDSGEYALTGIRGFYCQRGNRFELLIEEGAHVG